MNVFVSSTFEDLKAHREAVESTLRKMGHRVVCMEEYVASDERPIDRCLADVASADVYIGLFAWRYGFVPPKSNEKRLSVTELECRAAQAIGKPCLIFVLDPAAPWSPKFIANVTGEGQSGKHIARLRAELLRTHLVSFFESPSQLAAEATLALRRLELAKSVDHSSLRLADAELYDSLYVRMSDERSVLGAYPLDGSHTYEIVETALRQSRSSDAIEVNIGTGKAW